MRTIIKVRFLVLAWFVHEASSRLQAESNNDIQTQKNLGNRGAVQNRILEENENEYWSNFGDCVDGMYRGIESGYSISLSGDGKTLLIGSSLSVVLYSYDRALGWVMAVDFASQLDSISVGPYSVALSDDGMKVAIGSYKSRMQGLNTGSVQIFQRQDDVQTWAQMGRTLTAKRQGANFGHSLDLSADGLKAIIGAHGIDTAHIFEYDFQKTIWVKKRSLVPSLSNAGFGYAVAISGDGTRAIVGAPLANNRIGYASIYDIISFKFVHTINGDIEGAEYGSSVAMSKDGNVASLGAPVAGHVFVSTYTESDNSWGKLGYRLAIDDEGFGSALSLSSDGQRIAIGAPLNSLYGALSGHTYVYEYSETIGDWESTGEDFYGSNTFDNCGQTIALSSDSKKLVVSCSGSDANGLNSGQVCIYTSPATGDDDDFISPSLSPTMLPSLMPTIVSSSSPSISTSPTFSLFDTTTPFPTPAPTSSPTKNPTMSPTKAPSNGPSNAQIGRAHV